MVGVSIQIKSYISGDRSAFIDPMLLPSALLSRQGGMGWDRGGKVKKAILETPPWGRGSATSDSRIEIPSSNDDCVCKLNSL